MKQFLTVGKPELTREGGLKASPANNRHLEKPKNSNLLSNYRTSRKRSICMATRIVAFLYLKIRPIRAQQLI